MIFHILPDAGGAREAYIQPMNRRTLILTSAAAAAIFALPVPAVAQPIPLAELSGYFNSFRTAEAQFTQINPDGTIATGRLMIQRPGRVRFEYDPPDRNLVLATAGSVNIFDARGNAGPSVYPLSRTPLNLILAERVDLTRARMVVSHFSDGPTTSVVAQDPDAPEYGQIRLVFSADPTELRQWVITDDTGRDTTVILGQMRLGGSLSSALFDVEREMMARGFRTDR
jgi:outer membrane lipoprotein-sorting protein